MSGNKISLTKEQVTLIEELAQVNETFGSQPAMSKILGLLVVSDETELTFDQIKDTLALSKSAVSQALSQLLMAKKISYKTRIGDRKRYFHVRVADWDTQVLEQFNGILSLTAVYKKVLQVRPDSTQEFNANLKRMTEFLSMLHNQVIATYQKYQEENK
ncbi:GbsR/MarR family transcriptional regulator [Hufsiella ginkgonis]|uniref:MarR family transcriptional regulator n=1 Tax=Hufsiella ginkgonis TaxID=2695274 RepID=A0A7K1XWY9_9SPHI|nr:MarR family transcriptional regulator [Hufsiella ginkgonis]MXV15347.1 MarR family transcriptional regulator [Hufsiella ginkgonis]